MDNWIVYVILIAYIFVTFITSLIGRKFGEETPESYFLASRNLNTTTLFFTLIATNFSAFFFLGFAGEGYRIGYAYYAMMAIGTAFAAISFYLIGNKVWHLGKQKGYITPVELIGKESNYPPLKYTYLIVMTFFTLPYLAIQPIGAGYILENLTNGEIPYLTGATLLTIFIIIYVFLGGMRSVANTDVKQGILMIVLMVAAVWYVAQDLGGITAANERAFYANSDLFTRMGIGKHFTPARWFSFCLLWIACVPMFPQLFMRFFISRDIPTFKRTTLLYALIPCFLFILPVTIGVLGHLSFPNLSDQAADQILPKMLLEHTSPWFATLVMTGALAAFMSTVDSQLLALSTIFTQDIYLPFIQPKASLKKQVRVGKVMVVLFALIGLAIAVDPFPRIFDIVKMAFSGYAVLFLPTLFLLRWKGTSPRACFISILIGEFLVLAFYTGWIPEPWLLGFEPIVPILVTGLVVITGGSFFGMNQKNMRKL